MRRSLSCLATPLCKFTELEVGYVCATSALQHKYCNAAKKGKRMMPIAISSNNARLQAVLDDLRSGFKRFLLVAQQANKRRSIYRTTVCELNSLTNRDLADLGISRSHIRRLALEASQKEVVK